MNILAITHRKLQRAIAYAMNESASIGLHFPVQLRYIWFRLHFYPPDEFRRICLFWD